MLSRRQKVLQATRLSTLIARWEDDPRGKNIKKNIYIKYYLHIKYTNENIQHNFKKPTYL